MARTVCSGQSPWGDVSEEDLREALRRYREGLPQLGREVHIPEDAPVSRLVEPKITTRQIAAERRA